MLSHSYYHCDLDSKCNDTSNEWTFVSSCAWKNLINATIGGVGMLLSLHALKSLNNVKKPIQELCLKHLMATLVQ